MNPIVCMLTLVLAAMAFRVSAADPPIAAIEGISPRPTVFEVAKRDVPLILRSREDATAYFDDKALTALTKQVDFEKQFVLVFAWRGSGQDRLSYTVAESFPEQIFFKLTPGRTKDLRPHAYVYALRSNVKWSVR